MGKRGVDVPAMLLGSAQVSVPCNDDELTVIPAEQLSTNSIHDSRRISITGLTRRSRPNKMGLKCPSARPYVRPQNVSSISMKLVRR